MTIVLEDRRNRVVVDEDQISVTSVGIAGPAGAQGTGAYSAAYGCMYENDQLNTIDIIDTVNYFPWVTGIASGQEEKVTITAGEIIIDSDGAGVYEITAQTSFGGLNNRTVHGTVWHNDVLSHLRFERKLGTGGDVGSASIVGLISLAANDTLTLAFKADGTGTLDIQHFTLTIRRVGEHEYLGTEQFDAIKFNIAAGITDTITQGLMYWNADDKTVNVNVNGGPVLQVGQETYLYGSNKSGVEIPDGSVVYLSGAQADRATVALGDASDPIHARSTIGVATQTIANNNAGFTTVHGLVRGLDTLTPGWSEGDSLFLSAIVPGGLQTAPPPTPPLAAVFIGMVVRVHETEGSIYVNVADAGRVADHSDVLISSIIDGDVMTWVGDAATGRWENKAAAAGGGAVIQTALSDDTRQSVRDDPLSFYFVGMDDKTNAELITDGWEFDVTGATDPFVENGSGLIFSAGASGSVGARFVGGFGTDNFDMMMCASIIPDRTNAVPSQVRFGITPTSGTAGHVCEWRPSSNSAFSMEGFSGIGSWGDPGGASMGVLNPFTTYGGEVIFRIMRVGNSHYVMMPYGGAGAFPSYLGGWNYASHSISGNLWYITIWVEVGGLCIRWIRRLT